MRIFFSNITRAAISLSSLYIYLTLNLYSFQHVKDLSINSRPLIQVENNGFEPLTLCVQNSTLSLWILLYHDF
jgi:hypothetical protein